MIQLLLNQDMYKKSICTSSSITIKYKKMITEMITSGQEKQLRRVVEDGLDKVIKSFTKVQADQILAKGNFVQDDLGISLQHYAIIDQGFGPDLLNGKGRITFGSDFSPQTQIDEFVQKKDKNCLSTYYFNFELTSKKFAGVTDTPEIGKEYGVLLIPINNGYSALGQEIVDYMKTIPGIKFFGTQGETYLQEKQPEIFPTGKWTVSFDEKGALWKGADGNHWVPRVNRRSGGDCLFYLGYFENPWRSDNVLVCFCDLDQSSEA